MLAQHIDWLVWQDLGQPPPPPPPLFPADCNAVREVINELQRCSTASLPAAGCGSLLVLASSALLYTLDMLNWFSALSCSSYCVFFSQPLATGRAGSGPGVMDFPPAWLGSVTFLPSCGSLYTVMVFGLRVYVLCLCLDWEFVLCVSVWIESLYVVWVFGLRVCVLCLCLDWEVVCCVCVWTESLYFVSVFGLRVCMLCGCLDWEFVSCVCVWTERLCVVSVFGLRICVLCLCLDWEFVPCVCVWTESLCVVFVFGLRVCMLCLCLDWEFVSVFGLRVCVLCLCLDWEFVCCVCVWTESLYHVSVFGLRVYMLCLCLDWEFVCYVCVWTESLYLVFVSGLRVCRFDFDIFKIIWRGWSMCWLTVFVHAEVTRHCWEDPKNYS